MLINGKMNKAIHGIKHRLRQGMSVVMTAALVLSLVAVDKGMYAAAEAAQDFSCCELLIATSDINIFTENTQVLSEYNGIYLVGFSSAEETAEAYNYYLENADMVEINSVVKANEDPVNSGALSEAADNEGNTEVSGESNPEEDADISGEGNSEEKAGGLEKRTSEDNADALGESSSEDNVDDLGESGSEEPVSDLNKDETIPDLNNGDDALSNLNNTSISDYSGYVALIDTGASVDGNVGAAVSVIGDVTSDDNGHGTKMAAAMVIANPSVSILSIKALDSTATGSVSDVYAAIEYAIKAHVSIINLSLSSITTAESEVLSSAIEDAIASGIKVVASAGNNGRSASYFTPGNIPGVYTIGAADEEGFRRDRSNYGPSVDYYVTADSSSVAAARFSALLVNGLEFAQAQEDVFTREQAEAEKSSDEGEEEGTDDESLEEASDDENPEAASYDSDGIEEESKGSEEAASDVKQDASLGSETDAEQDGPVPEISQASKPSSDELGLATPTAGDILLRGADSASDNFNWIKVNVTLHSAYHPDSIFSVVSVTGIDPSLSNSDFTYKYAQCVDPGKMNPMSHSTQTVSTWRNYAGDTQMNGVYLKYVRTVNGEWEYTTDGSAGYGFLENPNQPYPSYQRVQLTVRIKPRPDGAFLSFKKIDKNGKAFSNIWFSVYGYSSGSYYWIGYMRTDENGNAWYILNNMGGDKASSSPEDGGLSSNVVSSYGNSWYYLKELGYAALTSDGYWYFYNPETYDPNNSSTWSENVNWSWESSLPSVTTDIGGGYYVPCSKNASYHTIGTISYSDWSASGYSLVYDNYSNTTCGMDDFHEIRNGHTDYYYAALKKVDSETGAAISNVTLKFMKSDGTTLGTAVTGNDGIALIEYTDYSGDITVKETAAPIPYCYISSNIGKTFSCKGFRAKADALAWAAGSVNQAKQVDETQFKIIKTNGGQADDSIDISKCSFTYYTKKGTTYTQISKYSGSGDRTGKYEETRSVSDGKLVINVVAYIDASSVDGFYIKEDKTSAANAGFDIERTPKWNGSVQDIYNDYGKVNIRSTNKLENGAENTAEDYSPYASYIDILKTDGTNNPDVAGIYKAVDMSKVSFKLYEKNGSSYTLLSEGTGRGNYQVTKSWEGKNLLYHFKLNKEVGTTIYVLEDKTSAKNAGFNTAVTPLVNGTSFNIYDNYYSVTTKDKETTRTINIQVDDFEPVPIKLSKSSSDSVVTKDNPNYSLNGTKYTFYKENTCTTKIGTIEVNEKGETKTPLDVSAFMSISNHRMQSTVIYYKETTAGKNYQLNTGVKSYTVKPSGTNVISEKDVPVSNPFTLRILKINELGTAASHGDTTLAGAEFTLKFYPQDITRKLDLSKSPSITRVVTSKEEEGSFYADISDSAKLPLGFITIQETKAPAGYLLDGAFTAYDAEGNVIETADASGVLTLISTPQGITAMDVSDGYKVADPMTLTKEEEPIRADIELYKVDETDSPMEGVQFKVTEKATGQSVILVTDENGYVSTASGYVSHFTDTNTGVARCGTWFGLMEEMDDDYGALFYGDYEIKELRCDANSGKQLEPVRTISKTDIAEHHGGVINVYDREASSPEEKNWNWPKPILHTTARVVETDSRMLPLEGTDVVDYTHQTIEDTVVYMNLRNHTDYTLRAELVVVDNEGNITPYMEKLHTFTTERDYITSIYEVTGTETIVFEDVDPTGFEGMKFVVFETLYLGTITDFKDIPSDEEASQYTEYSDEDDMKVFPVVHKDINDDSQTVRPVSIHTTATDGLTEDHVAFVSGEAIIIDRIFYTGLEPGKEYEVFGELVLKTIDRDDTKDGAEVEGIVAKAQFVADESDGYVDVEFKVDASDMAGKSLVAYEKLYYNDMLIARHTEIEDEEETVHFPSFGTNSWNSECTLDKTEDSAKEVPAFVMTSFTDTVSYNNLPADRTYIVRGVLMDKETGKPMVDATGREIRSEQTFVTEMEEPSEKSDKELPDETDEADDELSDETDEADDELSDETDETDDETEVEDDELFDVGCSGEVDVVFKDYDLTDLAGKNGVIFEEIYLVKSQEDETVEEVLVGEHKDIEDKLQFIYIVELHTTASDTTTDSKVIPYDINTIVQDKVIYSNVIPGKEYELKATLHVRNDKSGKYKDGDILIDENGNEVEVVISFTPEKSDGEIIVEIPVETSTLGTMEMVAFEEMRNDYGLEVAAHSDIDDEPQSVRVPGISTTATIDNGKKEAVSTQAAEIIDKVSYTNLQPGKEYKLSGCIMDKSTGEKLNVHGKNVTNEISFTPMEASGEIELSFIFDPTNLDTELVVYEKLYMGDTLIAVHEDIDDEGQTVSIVKPIIGPDITPYKPDDSVIPETKEEPSTETPEPVVKPDSSETPKLEEPAPTPSVIPHTGDNQNIVPIFIIMILSLVGIITFIIDIRKRRRKEK